jgi:hypothetical protein
MNYCIDDFILFRGVLFVKGCILLEDYELKLKINEELIQVCYSLSNSSDVANIHGDQFQNHRFEFHYSLKDIELKNVKLIFIKDDFNLEIDPVKDITKRDCTINSKNIFHDEFTKTNNGTIIEIGSRARSGITRKHLFKKFDRYVGLDIIEGENVDIVGDAHKMSNLFEANSISCIYSVSVFEHLINPLRVVYEMNKVLKKGGYCQINTHQTWPVHDDPWDFNRFSKFAWYGLFNKATGFEIIEANHGEPCFIAPNLTSANHSGLDYQLGYLSSKVIARKTNDCYIDIPYDNEYLINEYPY